MATQDFIRNDKCFVRKELDCGRYFGVSKTCFIACPDSEEIGLELSIITDKLKKEGIEPFIAVKERVYGEDIFCTKICGKIIESMFCIIILNDVKNGKKYSIPNPNVYYEYGMMTSMNKEVIPLLKNGQKPVFNIQSFDIVQYAPSNLSTGIEGAIKKTVAIISDKRTRRAGTQFASSVIKRIYWLIELMGLESDHKYIEKEWRALCKNTNFNVYMDDKNRLYFLGIFISLADPIEINGNIKVLLKRIDGLASRYDVAIKRLKNAYTEARAKQELSGGLPGFTTYGTTFEETPESVKRDLDNTTWNRDALDKILFIIMTPYHKLVRQDIEGVFKSSKPSFKIPEFEIWDDSKVVTLFQEKGLTEK